MRLMSVTLEGYKRFEQRTEIDVAGSVVALVGPNEAGKSSILQALISFERQEPFMRLEKTRNWAGETSIRMGYVLDDEDRTAIAHIPGGKKVRWWSFEKQDNGTHIFSLHPRPPRRDLSSRHKYARALRQFVNDEAVVGFSPIDDADVETMYDRAVAALESESETLNDVEMRQIVHLVTALGTLPVWNPTDAEKDTSEEDDDEQENVISEGFHEFLSELADYHEGLAPNVEAGTILLARRPHFILFSPEDRDLRTTYDLTEDLEDLPSALRNLSQLAGLDVEQLLEASTTGDPGKRTSLMVKANAELKRVFSQSWDQSEITVRMEIQGTVLELLVSIPEGDYTTIEERSSGLLSFVALRAFLARYDFSVPPILLVDEAEMHLHYDAQANLVDLFTEQNLAGKILYTTHSAGCLPQDLGNGVRVVTPVPGSERSSVRNSVWLGNEAGFTPLIFGMGATTFAFLPSRNVLLTEGVTDAMLLPTLFREAMKVVSLPFQTAPGLATVGPSQLLGLVSEGGSVLFLTDGDNKGQEYQNNLSASGIAKKNIFGLNSIIDVSISLEDLIDRTHYSSAVNEVLQDFQVLKSDYLPKDIPEFGRAVALENWCRKQGIEPPGKVAVVQRLLDLKASHDRLGEPITLIDKSRRRGVAKLGKKLCAAFPYAHKN